MNIKPLSDRVVVKSVEQEETAKGGIILAPNAQEKPQVAVVVAVGPGALDKDQGRIPMEVKVGDKVIVGKYSGTQVKLDGEEYNVVRQEDVLAIVD